MPRTRTDDFEDVRIDNGQQKSPSPSTGTRTPNAANSNPRAQRDAILARWTPEAERTLMRKIDIALIPWLSLLYLLSFLDRTSIGNASLYHMTADLHMTNDQYLWALTIFFFSYAIFEVRSCSFVWAISAA